MMTNYKNVTWATSLKSIENIMKTTLVYYLRSTIMIHPTIFIFFFFGFLPRYFSLIYTGFIHSFDVNIEQEKWGVVLLCWEACCSDARQNLEDVSSSCTSYTYDSCPKKIKNMLPPLCIIQSWCQKDKHAEWWVLLLVKQYLRKLLTYLVICGKLWKGC